MAIDLMNGYAELLQHRGHRVEIAAYGPDHAAPENISIECLACMEVLVSFDKPEVLGPDDPEPEPYIGDLIASSRNFLVAWADGKMTASLEQIATAIRRLDEDLGRVEHFIERAG